MDATSWAGRTRRCRWATLSIAVVLFLSTSASAAPIRGGAHARLAAQSAVPASGPGTAGAWSTFLAGGEATWASRQAPAFTLPVRQAILRLLNGDPALAASSPLISYMVWRRNLDVARFDFYHPFMGPRLPQGFTPPLIPPSNIPTPPDIPPLTPPNPSVIPPTVPEPNAFMVIVGGVAGALWMRRRGLARPAR